MGKPTGFIEWGRQDAPKRPVAERLRDANEVALPQPEEVLRQQGGRCMDCGVPFCQQGCPLGNPIPEFNDAVYRGRWREAWVALSSTHQFPEFTGRLCPAPCEAACVLGIDGVPVTIEALEKAIAERAFAEGWVVPQPPARRTGRTVGVVGSGPAGLAAASLLNRAGHRVTVYERADRPGGLLRYGIPDFKLERSVLERRLRVLEAEGVEFRCGVDAGGAVGFDALRAAHDALVLALGARRPRLLPEDVPGRELAGVVRAMEYLEAHNRHVAQGAPLPPALDARGRRVLVLGGGDTGSDCLGTALRQGAAEVVQLELLPAPPRARPPDNPWPQWPLVLRTSTSHEEGGVRRFGLLTKRLSGEGGALRALHAVPVALRPGPGGVVGLAEAGAEVAFEVDLLVQAMGFVGPETGALVQQLGVALDARGNVRVDAAGATSVPGVYCAGDAARGASLLVWAFSDGREAARACDAFLNGAAPRLPTRGAHLPFGGR